MSARHILSVLLITLCLGTLRAEPLAGSRPNIILVLTDDQGYGDLSCHGHPFVKTPNIDRLRSQSTYFTDYHVSPTCAPSRSAILTGRHPFKNGVTHTILRRERMALSSRTIADVLKTAGYTSGIFGKWHLGDEEPYQPHNRGFDEVFIHGCGGIGQGGDVNGNSYFDPIIRHNGTFVKTKGFCTDVFFRQALGWIKEQATAHKPFFAYIATNAPHAPFHAPRKYMQMYAKHAPTKGKRPYAAFFGMISNIDDNVGLLMGKLDEWELADNTLLIFMTDNGSVGTKYFKAGMRGGKNSPHEGGTRVPMFWRLPGRIRANVGIDHLTRHVDIMPTFAQLAGARLPADSNPDGRSLLPLIENPKMDWPDRYVFVHKGRWETRKGFAEKCGRTPEEAKHRNFAVRNERWRLVADANGKPMLFDIDKDRAEQNDVAGQHPEIVTEMMKAYDKWWAQVRPLMVNEGLPKTQDTPYRDLYEAQKKAGKVGQWTPPAI